MSLIVRSVILFKEEGEIVFETLKKHPLGEELGNHSQQHSPGGFPGKKRGAVGVMKPQEFLGWPWGPAGSSDLERRVHLSFWLL